MAKRLNTLLGYYTPAFFHIKIETNTSFKTFSDLDYSVFLHEYIHFIQDISTYYGLYNMYVYSDFIRYAAHKAYANPDKIIKIPVTPTTNNESNIYANKRICELTNGDTIEIGKIIEIKEISSSTDTIDVKDKTIEFDSTVIIFTHSDGKEDIATFGALCIMENMAYIMERLICPGYTKSPDFPYSIAEKIVETKYRKFGEDILNILALCDLSLQFSNPGMVFVEFLNEMINDDWLPQKPEDVYDRIYKIKHSTNGEGEISFEQNLTEFSSMVEEQVKGYFKDKIFNDLQIWVEHIMKTIKDLRFNDRYFILDIARGGKINVNKSFQDLKNKLGTPLVSNKTGEGTLHYPNMPKGVELGYFVAIGEIVSLFESGNTECKMQPLCIKENTNVDNRCKETPWTRCSDEKLCPYAVLWKHWNLKDITPKR